MKKKLAIICTIVMGLAAISLESDGAYAKEDSVFLLQSLKSGGYKEYMEKYKEVSVTDQELILTADDITAYSGNVKMLADYEGNTGKTVLTEETGYVEWEAKIPETGLYHIEISYYPVKGKNSAPVRELSIDGKVPFLEAANFTFSRVWQDAQTHVQDQKGNEVKPQQIETPFWRNKILDDYMGYEANNLKFYFTKGLHKIRLSSVREPLAIGNIRLFSEENTPDYDTLKQSYQNMGSARNISRKVQGEDTLYKSEPTIYPVYDRSSPSTEPYSVHNIRPNVIGGDKWQTSGQWIAWEVDVPESGLYKLGIKYRQNINDGAFSTRKLRIDGKVSFEEVSQIRFDYDSDWKMKIVGSDTPYLFYLEKGKHILELEAVLGDFGEIIRQVEDSVYELNGDYRQVLMLTGRQTGSNRDEYRDYNFREKLPHVIESFVEQAKIMRSVSDVLERNIGTKTSNIAVIDKMAYQLEMLAKDPEKLRTQLDEFSTNIGALSTWIMNMSNQPLEIDYIVLMTQEQEFPKAGAGLLEQMAHELRMFYSSFVDDYNTLGTLESDEEAITVWIGNGVTGGRNQVGMTGTSPLAFAYSKGSKGYGLCYV